MTPEHLVMILDDDNGISSKAYDALCDIVSELEGETGPMNDVLNAVKATENRFYLKDC